MFGIKSHGGFAPHDGQLGNSEEPKGDQAVHSVAERPTGDQEVGQAVHSFDGTPSAEAIAPSPHTLNVRGQEQVTTTNSDTVPPGAVNLREVKVDPPPPKTEGHEDIVANFGSTEPVSDVPAATKAEPSSGDTDWSGQHVTPGIAEVSTPAPDSVEDLPSGEGEGFESHEIKKFDDVDGDTTHINTDSQSAEGGLSEGLGTHAEAAEPPAYEESISEPAPEPEPVESSAHEDLNTSPEPSPEAVEVPEKIASAEQARQLLDEIVSNLAALRREFNTNEQELLDKIETVKRLLDHLDEKTESANSASEDSKPPAENVYPLNTTPADLAA